VETVRPGRGALNMTATALVTAHGRTGAFRSWHFRRPAAGLSVRIFTATNQHTNATNVCLVTRGEMYLVVGGARNRLSEQQ